jgi:hypothetical protein
MKRLSSGTGTATEHNEKQKIRILGATTEPGSGNWQSDRKIQRRTNHGTERAEWTVQHHPRILTEQEPGADSTTTERSECGSRVPAYTRTRSETKFLHDEKERYSRGADSRCVVPRENRADSTRNTRGKLAVRKKN